VISPERIDKEADRILEMMRGTTWPDSAVVAVLDRVKEKVVGGKTICALCGMAVAIGEPNGFDEAGFPQRIVARTPHTAACGLPCVSAPGATDSERHHAFDNCPRCVKH